MARLNLAHLLPKAGKSRAEEDEEEKDATTSEDQTDDETESEEDEDEKEAAEDEKDDEAEGDEDDKEAAGRASRVAAGFALVKSPEAKGREKLAAELGEDVAAGRMSAKRAKALLAAAPKASRLGDVMAGKDVNPGPSGGESPSGGAGGALNASDKKLVGFAESLAKLRGARRR